VSGAGELCPSAANWHIRCYKNHSIMVTVSLQPFAFRKIVVLIAALIWLTSAIVFADPVFMQARATQFPRQTSRVERRAEQAPNADSVIRTEPSATSESQLAMMQSAAPTFSVSLENVASCDVATLPLLSTSGNEAAAVTLSTLSPAH
jgi:hypothetical protein